jgi:hypothetical protein
MMMMTTTTTTTMMITMINGYHTFIPFGDSVVRGDYLVDGK